MITIPEIWYSKVSKAMNISTILLKKDVEIMLKNGRSISYIKKVLQLTALSKGKQLCFISKKGTN